MGLSTLLMQPSSSSQEPRAADAESDEALLRRYVEHGDREALGKAFLSLGDPAYRLARRMLSNEADAEDAVQNAFIQIQRHAATFKAGNSVKAWSMGFVINACRVKRREEQRRSTRQQRAVELHQTPNVTQSAEPERRELQRLVMSALEKLPETYRLPLWLHYFEGLASPEVASALQQNESTIRNHLSRGLQRLRTSLAASGCVMAGAAITAALSAAPAEAAPASLTQTLSGLAAADVPATQAVTSLAAKSLRVAGKKSAISAATMAIAAGTALAVAAGAIWLGSRQTPAQPKPLTAAPISSEPAETAPFFRHWNFNSPEQAADFAVSQGSWRHVATGGSENSGSMKFVEDKFAARIKLPIQKLPLLITARLRSNPLDSRGTGLTFAARWTKHKGIGSVELSDPVPLGKGVWHTRQIYVTDKYIQEVYQQTPLWIAIGEPRPDSELQLSVVKWNLIDDLTIREIPPNELPDVSEIMDVHEKIKNHKGPGPLELPMSRSAQQNKALNFQFVPASP